MLDKRWYAARAKPGQERIAIDNLKRQDFEAYYPRMTIERAKHGRVVRESEALFPGYLLIRFALATASWRAINSTRGVIRLLSFAQEGTPSPLPAGEIESLQEREKAGQLYVSEVVRLRRGDEVRIKIGWATDQIGTVVWTKAERVRLLLRLLGQEVSVIAPQHALEFVRRPQIVPDGSAVAFPAFLLRPVRVAAATTN